MFRIAAVAIIVLIGGGRNVTYAISVSIDLIVHESTEYFYDAGGTFVNNCLGLGCGNVSFSAGNVSGTVLWHVDEKLLYDPSIGTTTALYTLFNEASAPINSFQVSNLGFQATGEAPLGWSFAATPGSWIWNSASPGFAIDPSFFLDFRLDINGIVPIGFAESSITTFSGEMLSNPTWQVSAPVPEPSTLFIVAFAAVTGMIAGGLTKGERCEALDCLDVGCGAVRSPDTRHPNHSTH
jgi:hypothetical protein